MNVSATPDYIKLLTTACCLVEGLRLGLSPNSAWLDTPHNRTSRVVSCQIKWNLTLVLRIDFVWLMHLFCWLLWRLLTFNFVNVLTFLLVFTSSGRLWMVPADVNVNMPNTGRWLCYLVVVHLVLVCVFLLSRLWCARAAMVWLSMESEAIDRTSWLSRTCSITPYVVSDLISFADDWFASCRSLLEPR